MVDGESRVIGNGNMKLTKEKTWAALYHPSDNERSCKNCIHNHAIPTTSKYPSTICSIRAGMICDIYHNSAPRLLRRKWEWNWKYE